MRAIRLALAAVALSVFAAVSFAQVSKTNAEWRSGPASWLMTPEEKEQWKSVKADADAERFIALFWAKRDPSPDSPWNEFRQQFESRVQYADEKFVEGRTRGSLTDRGRIYIVFGRPALVVVVPTVPSQVRPAQPQSPVAEVPGMPPVAHPATFVPATPAWEVWTYEAKSGRSDDFSGDITFQLGSFKDDYRLQQALERVIRKAIKQPDLKEIPRYALLQFRTEELHTAIDAFRAATVSPYRGKEIFISWDECVDAAGEYFVPVSLYVPYKTGLTDSREYIFFGIITDESGKSLAIFEEPAHLTATKHDLYFDKSLMLPGGKLTATLGIAEGAKPLTMTTVAMSLTGKLDKSAPAVSRLILSTDIHPSNAQNLTDPFVFGGIKVVPKGDKTFRSSDDLWYFFELRNPGLDRSVVTAPKPRVQVKLDITGLTTDGENVGYTKPPIEVEAMALKGAPGHFAIGHAIPLATFKPGAYVLKVTVTDVVRKSESTVEDRFQVFSDTQSNIENHNSTLQ